MSGLGLLLLLAALLTILIGAAHSILGERYVLPLLLRRPDLPKLLGSSEFTARTLRFVWHLTTIAWWGFAAFFFLTAQGPVPYQSAAAVLAYVFLASAVLTAVASRFRHFAWLVFLVIGLIALYGSQA